MEDEALYGMKHSDCEMLRFKHEASSAELALFILYAVREDRLVTTSYLLSVCCTHPKKVYFPVFPSILYSHACFTGISHNRVVQEKLLFSSVLFFFPNI